MEVKICKRCNIEQPIDQFRIRRERKNGRQANCIICLREKSRIQSQTPQGKARIKRYAEANKERTKIVKRIYLNNNKEKTRANQNAYNKKHKEKLRAWERNWKANRRKTDALFNLKNNLRCRTYGAFIYLGVKKNTKSEQLLGANYEIVKSHIERQFTKGMKWNNYGEWQVDHVIPLSSAKTEEDLIILCHYTNLQPLWKRENLSKNNKILPTQTKLTI